ncbi:MAG TPA: DbpA RNA binding domain-containing protein, partial [Treponemataceae bacterium]|nr:DbpA RNA binding domain-containing protein [Treponemataceae bacterium]
REVKGSDASHVRLYVGIGRRDGITRRGVAQLFRDLVGVPERLVDRIEVLDAFSLATLPADAARAALDLSKQRRNVPHMHVDVKSGGGDFHAGPRQGRPGGSRSGPRTGGPREFNRGGPRTGGPREFNRSGPPRDSDRGPGAPGRRNERTYSRGSKPGGAEAYRKKAKPE